MKCPLFSNLVTFNELQIYTRAIAANKATELVVYMVYHSQLNSARSS